MADAAETAAPAAPAAAASETPSDGGGIKSVAEAIEGVLAKPTPKPTPKPDPTAAPKGKPPEKGRRVEKLEQNAVAAAAVAPAPEEGASASEKARYYLKHGDVAKAIDAAFGNLSEIDATLPEGVREALARKLAVNSAQWERLRKHEQATKRAFNEREQKLGGIIQNLQREYAPLHQARQAYAAADYDAAFKLAFGEDATEFQRKVIGQRVGKNPEVERLRAELEQERAQQRQWAEQQRQQQAQAEQQQAVNNYVAEIGRELSQSDDAAVRKYASRPAYVGRVFEILRHHYDAATNTTIPLTVAAEAARDEILNSLKDWRIEDETSGLTAAPAARASVLPAKPPVAKGPARSLKQSGAAEATGAQVKLTSAQIREKYQRIMSAEDQQ
jgi:hypothetical protein